MTGRGAAAERGRAALAIFTRVPGAGPAKTRLAADLGPARAEALARAFLCDTLQRVRSLAVAHALWYTPPGAGAELGDLLRESGAAWNVCGAEDPAWPAPDGRMPRLAVCPQSAGLLDERLERAIGALLARGHERVCVIGSDSPTLPPARIAAAFDALRSTEYALIPAQDGGFTLLGARECAPGLLAGIEWSTDRVCAQACERLQQRGSLAVLVPSYDIDTAADLHRLAGDPELTGCPATRALLLRWGLLPASAERGKPD